MFTWILSVATTRLFNFSFRSGEPFRSSKSPRRFLQALKYFRIACPIRSAGEMPRREPGKGAAAEVDDPAPWSLLARINIRGNNTYTTASPNHSGLGLSPKLRAGHIWR